MSLIGTNPKGVITQLCSSHLECFQCLSAPCFGFLVPKLNVLVAKKKKKHQLVSD